MIQHSTTSIGSIRNRNTSRAMHLMLATTACLVGFASHATAQVPTNSWDYDNIVAGNVSKDTAIAGQTDISVTGGNGYVEGNADIYTGHTVNVKGDGVGRFFAYKDNRATIETNIDGALNSNMEIIILDKDGVVFGKNARIDVQGIVASTGHIDALDVMDGDDVLTILDVDQGGDIEINGEITVAEAGLAAFVAPNVVNNGVINAKASNVVIGAAQKVVLDMFGDGLVSVTLDGALADAVLENNGTINAEGGYVQITAEAAKATLDEVVNNEGVINVASATVDGGTIILSGGSEGTVNNSGVLKTSEGGSVEISGERFTQSFKAIVVPSTKPRAHAGQPSITADGGDVMVETEGDVVITSGAIDAQGGDITFDNEGTFTAPRQSIRTEDDGEVTIRQNNDASIQVAVDAIKNDGDGENLIVVGAGDYEGDIGVGYDNLTLEGANAGVHGRAPARDTNETTISGERAGFYVVGDNVTIDGFEIDGGLAGVRGNGSDGLTVQNNVIHDQFSADAVGDVFGSPAAGDGIAVADAADVTIDSNHIFAVNDDGIQADRVHNITITKNVINGKDPLDTVTPSDMDIGIAVQDATGKTEVSFNTVTHAVRDGIQLNNVVGEAELHRNLTFHTGNAGISLIDVTAMTSVDDNMIAFSNKGIDVVGSENIVIGDQDGDDDSGNVIRATDVGIEISSSKDITVEDNTIVDTGTGLAINGSNVLNIHDNAIEVTGNAIAFSDNFDGKAAYINGNEIEAGENGIYFKNGISENSVVNIGADVNGNIILAKESGVKVEGDVNDARLRLTSNSILAEGDAVSVDAITNGGNVALWYGNAIGSFGGDAVSIGEITDSAFSSVGNLGFIGAENGIEIGDVTDSSVAIVDNDIIVGENGIVFDGVVSNSSVLIGDDGLDGQGSGIIGADGQGVLFADRVEASQIMIGEGSLALTTGNNAATYLVTAREGVIIGASENAVKFGDEVAEFSTIEMNSGNEFFAGDDGVDFDGIVSDSKVTIEGSFIEAAEDGVDFDSGAVNSFISVGSGAFGTGNEILAGSDAIDIDGVLDNTVVTIDDNLILLGEDDGVDIAAEFSNGSVVDITGNDDIVGFAGNGITVVNTATLTDGIVNIADNLVDGSALAGAAISNVDEANIAANTIVNNDGAGVLIDGVESTVLDGNMIDGNAEYGFYAAGVANGSIALTDNTFTDNGAVVDNTNARVESGDVDLSGAANTFTNTSPSPATALQLDGVNVSLVGETLGGTVFDGYDGVDQFYVRIEDGTLMDGAVPIVIDGANASFDGFVPSTLPILSVAQRDALEANLFDADDAPVNLRGQIFVGDVPPPVAGETIENFNDFFPAPVEGGAPATGGGSVQILGLPSTGLEAETGGLAGDLNNLAPNAGGDDLEDLAGIEPAAGDDEGSEVSCIEDAVGSLGVGAVTYNFGGSFEESLAGAANCVATSGA